MKKLSVFLTGLAVLLITFTYSQPTFTAAGIPPVGTVTTSYEVDPPGVNEGPSGANQTWNFGSATPTGLSSITTIVNKASTPYGSSFPTANLATQSTSTQGNPAYAYFFYNTSKLELLGFGIQSNPAIVLNYSNARTVMPFPFTYNTSFMDTYAAFATYTISGFQVNLYRNGVVNTVADAWGTLTTPGGGPYTGCLRVKQVETVNDSSVVAGIPGATISTDKITTYSWSKNNATENLFSIIYDTLNAGGSTSFAKTVSYGTLATGIVENAPVGKPLAVHPNPVAGNASIHIQSSELDAGPAELFIHDAQGRLVKTVPFSLQEANHKMVSVEVTEFPAGLYFLRIEQAAYRFTGRFIKN